jgi:multiple sugar transport system ATP-binding protein
MTMADTIVVMNGGRVEQIGSPLDLYDRPANLFVAGFIGSPAMNFLRGKIEGHAFNAGDGITLPLPSAGRSANGTRLVYGIRPEHLRLTPDGVPATVQLVEPTGSETQVTLRLGETHMIAAFRERITTRPGETIHIGAEPALAHLFDAETGRRLED